MTLYLLLTAAAQGSQVLGQETELHADQVGNGQLYPTGANHQVKYSGYTTIFNAKHLILKR